jgi:hypothetical protein
MSLKDELVKAGLVSAKQARQVAHRERVARQQPGAQPGAARAQQEAEARAEQARQEREAQRARDQQLARDQQARQAEHEREIQERARSQAQIDAALRDGRLERWQGGRAYYFTDGTRIEFVSVSDDAARRLQEGTAAIVRSGDPGAPYTLLNAAQALRLRELAPERVVTLHPRLT